MRLLTGLRAFHFTARLGSTTAAGQKMGVGQPTVSAHIGSLEREFGVELFNQIGRRLVPTEFSESLLLLTDRLFELEQEAQDLLMEAHGIQRGHLRIAAVGPYNVMPVLARFRGWYPGIQITLSVGDSRDIVDRVLNFKADIGVLVHAVGDERVLSMPFQRQALVVFGHREHRLARQSSVRMTDLDGEDMVCREPGSTTQDVFDAALAKAGVRVNRVMQIGSRESVREAVACGIGLGVVSDIAYVPDERLRRLAISDLNAHTHSHVICLRERLRSRLVKAFLHMVEEVRNAGSQHAPDSSMERNRNVKPSERRTQAPIAGSLMPSASVSRRPAKRRK